MIELTALREQLKLLGHNLPEDQIVGILKEMNIDFDDDGADATTATGKSYVSGQVCKRQVCTVASRSTPMRAVY